MKTRLLKRLLNDKTTQAITQSQQDYSINYSITTRLLNRLLNHNKTAQTITQSQQDYSNDYSITTILLKRLLNDNKNTQTITQWQHISIYSPVSIIRFAMIRFLVMRMVLCGNDLDTLQIATLIRAFLCLRFRTPFFGEPIWITL